MSVAFEFGYRCAEKGMNLERAMEEFYKITCPDPTTETPETRLTRLAQKFSVQRPIYLSRELNDEVYDYFIEQGEHSVSFANAASARAFAAKNGLTLIEKF